MEANQQKRNSNHGLDKMAWLKSRELRLHESSYMAECNITKGGCQAQTAKFAKTLKSTLVTVAAHSHVVQTTQLCAATTRCSFAVSGWLKLVDCKLLG